MSTFKDFKPNNKNPFLTDIAYTEKMHLTKIKDTKEKIVDNNGKVTGKVVYAQEKGYDKTPFVKIYHKDIKYIENYSKHGIKLFIYILFNLKHDLDTIVLDPNLLVEYNVFKSAKYAYQGLVDNLESGLIAKSETASIYYINPSKVFVGQRRYLFMGEDEKNYYW